MSTTTTTTTEDRAEIARGLGFDLEAVPTEYRERVAALIPSPRVAEGYVGRKIHGVQDFDLFATAMARRVNVLLEGPTGSAKTTALRAFASACGLPFYAVPVHGAVDPSTLWGFRGLEAGETTHTPSEAHLVARFGGVLAVDEINMAAPRTLAATFGLFDVRRAFTLEAIGGVTIKAAPALLIGATMNPRYEGTARLNEALVNRFPWRIEWGYVREIEEALTGSPALVAFAEKVRDLGDVRTPTPTNALQEYVEAARLFGPTFARGVFLARYDVAERAGVARALEMVAPTIMAEIGVGSE